MVKKEAKKTERLDVNLKLWNKYCETDPSITKKVSQRGGYTAIDAQAQLKQGTTLWGSFGNKWGLRDLCYNMIYEDNKPIALALVATFFYPKDTTGSSEIKFPIGSDIAYKPGNDCYKKIRTDCLTKALSQLGFAADVFLGKFDDNKYVAEMTAKFKADTVPDVKVFTPDAKAMGLLEKIAAKYVEVDGIYFQDHIVDMDKLKAAVFNKYGKYPSKEAAVDKIVNEISAKDVSVKKEN